MGTDAMLIGVRVRRFMFISTKTCYRSICNHPFLVFMVCFLIFLYRSFPFMFSLFVSVSPVLVCTAVLLGTLLSFGQPNIPEIEREEKVTHGIASLKTGVVEDTTIVERDGSFVVESYLGKKTDIAENSAEGAEGVDNKVSEECEYGGSADSVPFVDESLQEIQCEKRVIEEMDRQFDDSNWVKKKEIDEEMLGLKRVLSDGTVVEDQYSLLGKEGDKYAEVEDDESPIALTHADKEDFSPSSSWKHRGEEEDEGSDEDGDQSSDPGSDGAESSSPDASMTDIMPMLDELHPLLDIDAPQPAHRSHDGSDDGSEGSHKSDESSDESDEDIEKQAEEEEDGEDDEEEVPGGKEDGSKSAITWTETDQKNLMELGTLEIERNRRLESLIARRRLRKSMKLMAEKNLIDLDGADLPFNVPPISTARQNPFDLPYDSYDNMGLPPIPGSAPSILQPRQNPFDLPYDSNEEKPDLKGDSFQQEFTAFQQREALQQREISQQREAFFRRHESFSAGPSSLGGLKRDRHDTRFKPYFVPEGMASEGMSYHTLHRQSSELSESKASSVPDTESVSSALDDEDKKLNQQDISQETESISNIDHTSDHVEHGSQSSDIDSLDTEQAEKRDVLQEEVEITLGDVEGHHEMVSTLSETGRADASVDLNSSQIDLNTEPFEEVCSSRSSLSSLSEVDERISDVRQEEESSSLEPQGNQIEGSHISAQASFAESDFQFASEVVDDNHHREPVYDSSPPAIEKYLSFSSISSDTQAEISEMGSPPIAVGSGVQEYKLHSESVDSSSQVLEVRENQSRSTEVNQSRSTEVKEFSEQDVAEVETSGVVSDYDNQNGQVAPEPVVQPNPVDSSSSPLKVESVDGHVNHESVVEHNSVDSSSFHSDTASVEGCLTHEQDKAGTNNCDTKIPPAVHQDVVEKLDSPAFKESTSSAPEEQQPSPLVEHVSAVTNVSNSEVEPADEPVLAEDELHQLEKDEIQSSSSSDYESIKNGMTPKGRNFQSEVDQFHSSSFGLELHNEENPDACKKLETAADSDQTEPSNYLSLSAQEKQQPPLVDEQVFEAHRNLLSSEPEHLEEHSSNKEATSQFEQDEVQSSSSDLKVDAGLLQNADVELTFSGSGHLDGPFKEKLPSILEKQPSWSDKSMVEPTFDEPQEPSTVQAELRHEVSNTSTAHLREAHDPEDKISTRVSSVTSDIASVHSESPEYKSPVGEEDMKETIFDRIVYEDHSEASEQFNNSAETFGFHDADQNTNQEADEIHEIDEGLLSELDSVGDFNVKEVVGESVHTEQLPGKSSNGEPESSLLTKDSNLTETILELPILEARSVEDIELAFKQLHEGADVEEVILPSMIEDQLKDTAEFNSNIAVVEARSLEDINIALKGVSESSLGEHSKRSDLKENLSEAGANEVVSPKIESNNVEAGVQESSVSAADDKKSGLKETSENPSMSEK